MKTHRFQRLLILACLLVLCSSATAHPLAPALLEINHRQASTYSVLWRLSAVQMKGIAPQPVLPGNCQQSSELSIEREAGLAVASRWDISCEHAGLRGQIIRVHGLERNPINVVLRLRTAEGQLLQTLLDGNNPSYKVPSLEQTGSVFTRYLLLGVEHLSFGPDHLLFLLALVLIVGINRKLIWTLTAFTVGHSITLSLASLGLITANPALMELGIALSLIVVARELLSSSASFLGRHPAFMAASFGLLHGMGFAGALRDIGLPDSDLVSALVAFNIGIELAQLGIVMLIFVLTMALRSTSFRPDWNLKPFPAYFIGSFATMWCIERSLTVLV